MKESRPSKNERSNRATSNINSNNIRRLLHYATGCEWFWETCPTDELRSTTGSLQHQPTIRQSTNLFLDPVLHACIRAHPYNTDQLPLRVGEPQVAIEMTYNFFFTNLLLFESDGTIGFKAFLRFEWQDSNRVWNFSQMPVPKVHLPHYEVWTPQFSLANCESELCHILPHNRTNVGVEHDGTVTLVVQIKQHATCVMNLRVGIFPRCAIPSECYCLKTLNILSKMIEKILLLLNLYKRVFQFIKSTLYLIVY